MRCVALWGAFAAAAAASGCGSGGAAPAAPAPAPSPAPPSLQLAYASGTNVLRVGAPALITPSTLSGDSVAACSATAGSASAALSAAGLAVDPSTCAIGGTPTGTLAPTLVGIQALGAANTSATASLMLEVQPRRTGIAYVARGASNSVGVYSADPASGELTLDSSIPAGTEPRGLAIDTVHRRVYVAGYAAGTINRANIDTATGSLSALTAVANVAQVRRLSIDPQGRFLFSIRGADNGSVGELGSYRIDAGDGSLVANPPILLAAPPAALTVSGNGTLLYVSMPFDGITRYTIDQTTGEPGNAATTIAGSYDVVANAAATRLYSLESLVPRAFVFTLGAAGSMTTLQIFSLPGPIPSVVLALNSAGTFLYAANAFAKSVDVLGVSALDGKLAWVSTTLLPNSCTPQALAMTPDGARLHVGCSGANGSLLGYAADAGSGALSALTNSPGSVDARAIGFVTLP